MSGGLKELVGIAVRHAATAGGTMTTASGVQSDDWRIALIGATVTIVGLVLSYLEKRGRA